MLYRIAIFSKCCYTSLYWYVSHITKSDGDGFSIYLLKILFKTVSTEHQQQLKVFKLKYLGPVKATFLVITLQYELAWQINHWSLNSYIGSF